MDLNPIVIQLDSSQHLSLCYLHFWQDLYIIDISKQFMMY